MARRAQVFVRRCRFPAVGLVTAVACYSWAEPIREILAIPTVGSGGRYAVQLDPIQSRVVTGQFIPPKAGDQVLNSRGEARSWGVLKANADGWFEDRALQGGYAYASVRSTTERIAVLHASGHSMVYVNGEPRAGDPYGYGFVRLPIQLKKGTNELLFAAGRGRLHVELLEVSPSVGFEPGDPTLPDIVVGARTSAFGAIVIRNASTSTVTDLQVYSKCGDGREVVSRVPPLLPLSVRKVAFSINSEKLTSPGSSGLELVLRRRGSMAVVDRTRVSLRVREATQSRQVTFLSGIDGSVQYYGLQPANGNDPHPALVLSLHGASVEAIGQADAYAPKSWAHIVAPTNRRPFGFDWEDWGRLDALEVLRHAAKTLGTDPQRVYLTGHSMGGHGAWQLSTLFPGTFAAVGPSAGWVSFWSYGGAPQVQDPDSIESIFLAARSTSDTLALQRNLTGVGVYVLHGDADDNVPVSEARTMVSALSAFHKDLQVHEQPGAGHWWDVSDEPGADCVDWAPMFDLFQRRKVAEGNIRQVQFGTMNPGVSAWRNWVCIAQQQKPHTLSEVTITADPWARRFQGITTNVHLLCLRTDPLFAGPNVSVRLDGQDLPAIAWPSGTGAVWLRRNGEKWTAVDAPAPGEKGPHRYGLFKAAFQHHMVFVYGTGGSKAERDWAQSKARYDAESFWYRGNGSIDVVPDSLFDTTRDLERSVILYGNSNTNSAWEALLSASPIQVGKGQVRVGARPIEGSDLAMLFVRPRPGSNTALVGVVTGTGITGMRLTDRMPYFVSGVAYPDWFVASPSVLREGAKGILAAGFFGTDWKLDPEQSAWR